MANELVDKRQRLVAEMQTITRAANDRGDSMTQEEFEKFDRISADVDNLKRTIDAQEAANAESRDVVAAFEPVDTPTPAPVVAATEVRSDPGSKEYRQAFDAYVRTGREDRALEVGTKSEGGYLVTDEWHSSIVESRTAATIMRGIATVVSTASGTFSIPTVASQGTASWGAEEGAVSESDDAFGQVQLTAHPMRSLIKVSNELLSDNSFDLTGYIAKQMGRRLGALEDAAFIDGDDSSKPKGLIYNSTVSVTAASATAITASEIVDLFHSLAREYRDAPNACFIANDSTVKLIRKLVDSDGRFLWGAGLTANEPDTILGKRFFTSSDVGAPTAAKKALVFCDPSYYFIAERQGMTMQRLDELYANTNQTGFQVVARVDGELVLAAASHVLQMASS